MVYRVVKESKGRYETLYFGTMDECIKYMDKLEDKKGVFVERAYGYYDAKQKTYYRYGEIHSGNNQ